jgi:COPII coat assembly protein SEC16
MASELGSPSSSMASISYGNLGPSTSEQNETPISVSALRPSTLDRIQEFLLRGERRKAYHYALDQKLWAHAMVIASSIDKEAWQEVVNEFVRTELGRKSEVIQDSAFGRGASGSSITNGRESLRVAYSMFSGQGAASGMCLADISMNIIRNHLVPVQQLLSQNILSRTPGNLQVPTVQNHITPSTPNFPSTTVNVPVESLSLWFETAAMLLSSPMSSECSAALTALGDNLMSNQWTEAAHVW